MSEYVYKKEPRPKVSNDERYTERYAVIPTLEFMEPLRGKIIWCPFSTEESEFVKVFREFGFNVVYSHIKYGQDFFHYQPKKFDAIIDNPHFTGKRETFQRAMSFNKPFALLMRIDWLNDSAPFEVLGEDMQLLFFKKRMKFKGQGNKINFSCGYFCRDFLPEKIKIRDFKKQLSLLA